MVVIEGARIDPRFLFIECADHFLSLLVLRSPARILDRRCPFPRDKGVYIAGSCLIMLVKVVADSRFLHLHQRGFAAVARVGIEDDLERSRTNGKLSTIMRNFSMFTYLQPVLRIGVSSSSVAL
jgi:hypothetical protein